MRECSIEFCRNTAKSRGWCNRHYENWRCNGSPISRNDKPLAERVAGVGWDVTAEGCWEWRGRRNEHGYGLYSHQRVHRLMYLFEHGDEPPLLRHTCDNPPCVNPSHLLPGTMQDNMQDMVDRGRHWLHGRTECPNGHDVTVLGSTRVVRKGGQVSNWCVECSRDRQRRYEQKRRAA